MPRSSVAPIALVLTLVATAGDADARPFGEKGQYIVTTDANLDYQRDTIRIDGADDVTRTRFSFRLAGDYTSFRKVSFGMEIGFDGEIEGFDTAKGFRFGGRAGYVLPLGAVASLWPRAGLSFDNTTYQTETAQVTVRSTRLTASLPVLFNPYPQVLVGLGPTFDHDLSAKAATTVDVQRLTGFGVHMTLGFWWE